VELDRLARQLAKERRAGMSQHRDLRLELAATRGDCEVARAHAAATLQARELLQGPSLHAQAGRQALCHQQTNTPRAADAARALLEQHARETELAAVRTALSQSHEQHRLASKAAQDLQASMGETIADATRKLNLQLAQLQADKAGVAAELHAALQAAGTAKAQLDVATHANTCAPLAMCAGDC
jgi:hypothetical protein